MSDLISRKGVFIPDITVEMFRNASLESIEDLMASGEMEDILLPSAQPEQRWIPCSERLPEANGRYLATRGLNACGALWNRTYIINYSDLMGLKSERIWWDGNVGKSDFERFDDVVAWMPLPEPYEGEGQ